jgi:hypothetical protein
MLDRLISGAGALTDLADRSVRVFTRRSAGDLLGHRPGSVAVAALLAALALVLVLVGLEATDNPTPRSIAPAVGSGEGIGNRIYSTVGGGVSSAYVETYLDDNGNAAKDEGETSEAWFYFMVDPSTREGVTVRSARPPSEVYRIEADGKVVEDATYLADDAMFFADTVRELGITLDRHRLVDASLPVGGSPQVVDIAAGLPPDGTSVRIAGERSGGWVPVCRLDPNRNGTCDDDEVDSFDLVVFDEVSKRGIVLVTHDSPEFTPATFTGMLRRDERAVSEAKTAPGLGFGDLDITVSDHFVLDDGTTPASAPLAFGLAAVVGLVAGTILIGLAGGYLIYRRDRTRALAPARSLAIGDRIPLKVTGVLRFAGGRIHVREAPADLLRFQSVVTTGTEPTGTTEPSSTLIIERRDRPEGVAVGRGELTRLTAGSVFPLRGRRPALRVEAGTGPLLLSFGSEADRDRAAGELLDETKPPPTTEEA